MTLVCEPSSTVSVLDILDIVDTALATLDARLPAHVSRDDLASAGKAALIVTFRHAVGTADEVRAYCFARVRGAMFDELRRLDPLSRRTRTRVKTVRHAAARLEQSLGRVPTDRELADEVGITPDGLRQVLQIGEAADAPRLEVDALAALPDAASPSPADFAESGDLVATIRAALGRLPPKQARVVQRYHLEEATLDEIAVELGISAERVRQLRLAAEKKLREDLFVLALWQAALGRVQRV